MADPPRPRPPLLQGLRLPAPVAALILLNCAVEIALAASDERLLGTRYWRQAAYQYGAFWSGLLRDWQPNYPGQPVLMFVTYSVLHGGLGHLAGNMIVLALFGRAVCLRMGSRAFLVIYGASALGGGLAFGLLSRTPAPMVGASGAIFGLVGALVLGRWRHDAAPLQALLSTVAIALLNVLAWRATSGHLAWEAHLGGFLAGALAAELIDWHCRRSRPPANPAASLPAREVSRQAARDSTRS